MKLLHILLHTLLIADTSIGLQRQLDGLLELRSRFQMIGNKMNTKYMVFGKDDKNVFIFNSNNLEIAKE